MGVIINWHNNTLFDFSTSIFYDLHWEMLAITDCGVPELTDNLERLMIDLQAGYDGIGLDIANYINSKNELTIFINLLKAAIKEYNKKHPNVPLYIR